MRNSENTLVKQAMECLVSPTLQWSSFLVIRSYLTGRKLSDT